MVKGFSGDSIEAPPRAELEAEAPTQTDPRIRGVDISLDDPAIETVASSSIAEPRDVAPDTAEDVLSTEPAADMVPATADLDDSSAPSVLVGNSRIVVPVGSNGLTAIIAVTGETATTNMDEPVILAATGVAATSAENKWADDEVVAIAEIDNEPTQRVSVNSPTKMINE